MDNVLRCRGWLLPPGETHLSAYLIGSPDWRGRGTYQHHKLEAVLDQQLLDIVH